MLSFLLGPDNSFVTIYKGKESSLTIDKIAANLAVGKQVQFRACALNLIGQGPWGFPYGIKIPEWMMTSLLSNCLLLKSPTRWRSSRRFLRPFLCVNKQFYGLDKIIFIITFRKSKHSNSTSFALMACFFARPHLSSNKDQWENTGDRQ